MILEIKNLSVHYGTLPILRNISLSIHSSSLVALMGPNGAGKSTLLKALVRLIPFSGEMFFRGLSNYAEFRHRIAFIPQSSQLDWNFPLNSRELVLMGSYGELGLSRRPQKKHIQRLERLVEELDLGHFIHTALFKLSGGQRQRLLIARALMQEAELFLLDEPLVGIDLPSQELVWNILHRLRSKGAVVMMVHHDPLSALENVDRVILLNRRILGDGTPQETLQTDLFLKTFSNATD